MQVRAGVNLSTRDYSGYREDMINQLKAKIPEYSDFSSSDMGIVLIELLATQLDSLSYYVDKITNELFLDTAYEKESVSRLARMIGYEMAESTPARFQQVFEIIPQDKPYTIPKGFKITTEDVSYEQTVTFEVEQDLVIPANCTGLETDEEGNYLYMTTVVEGETITNEVLGTGTDTKDLRFEMYYYPVIHDSVRVFVTDYAGTTEWTQVDNFISSDSSSKHYTLTLSEEGIATIKFGNGISGMIPDSIEDGIFVTYRIGGGITGNVGVNTINQMPQKPAFIKRTFNPYEPLEKGTDTESVDKVRVKAPANLGTKYGIVTLTDYKNLALGNSSVLRANSELIDDVKVTVAVYYILEPDAISDQVIADLTMEYNNRKMLGTKFKLIEGTPVPLDITVEAKLQSYSNRDFVRQEIEKYFEKTIVLGNYDFTEIPEPSDFIPDILDIEGVRSAYVTFPEMSLNVNEILTLGNLTINLIGGEMRVR